MKNNKPKTSLFSNNKFLLYTNIILVILVLFLVFLFFWKNTRNDHDIILRDHDSNFKLTNPILDCEDADQDDNIIISSSNVSSKIDDLKQKYNLSNLSFYFRDLNNGPWIGLGERDTFSPASLLKTPVVMALFKYAETNPDILAKEILITESDVERDANQNIIFPGLKKDTKYTLLQVAESVIKNSDNAGVPIIINNIPSEYIGNVFNSIGVPYKDTKTEVNLRVKDYAAFFRVLFNSSYLNREMSEKLLGILSESQYKNGIVAGIPEGITVAHKFGERKTSNVKQLHDCGVVYFPENPYLICIMTKGNDFKKQESAIGELSGYIYQEIKKNKDK